MTLGRTSSGAIKVKTDGGLRAVNCACCGCDICGFMQPKAPPDDPDFLKKLRGNDPSVAPFTQAVIDYNILISVFGTPASSAAGTAVFSWGEPVGECYYPSVIKSINSPNCEYGGSDCGSCSITNFNVQPTGIALMTVLLREDGCLHVSLSEEFFIGGFDFATGPNVLSWRDEPCVDDEAGGRSITVNGVSYPTYAFRFADYDEVTGSINITFS